MSDPQNKRLPGRPRTVDRQGAIERATDTYWREGVGTLSLNELCRRVQLSKPALYREFGGEDGLMDAALEHYRGLVVEPLLQALKMDMPFSQLVELLIVEMTSPRATPAGCLFTELRLARSRLGTATSERMLAMEQERRAAFEAWFSCGLKRNEVIQVPASLAARYIDTQLATVLTQLGAGEPPELVREQARLALGALLA